MAGIVGERKLEGTGWERSLLFHLSPGENFPVVEFKGKEFPPAEYFFFNLPLHNDFQKNIA